MRSGQLIVCERKGRWAVGMRRQLGIGGKGRRPVVCSVRSLQEVELLLDRWPASFVAVEVTVENLESVLSWLARVTCQFSRMRAGALVERESINAELILREAGAEHVTHGVWALGLLKDMALKHLESAVQGELDVVDEIVADLPWSRWNF